MEFTLTIALAEGNSHDSIAKEFWPLGGEIRGASYPLPAPFRDSPELHYWPHHLLVGIFEYDNTDAPPDLVESSGTDNGAPSTSSDTESDVADDIWATAGAPTTKPSQGLLLQQNLSFPCVDCGRITGCFCDYCWAIDRIPKGHWFPWQRTPLCTSCNERWNACRFCREIPSCTPFGHYATSAAKYQH